MTSRIQLNKRDQADRHLRELGLDTIQGTSLHNWMMKTKNIHWFFTSSDAEDRQLSTSKCTYCKQFLADHAGLHYMHYAEKHPHVAAEVLLGFA